ncbi:hypothetical protein ACH4F6_30470 [Streptomyces sp. NPDC017936]|uniref:hypothetical protein n=1 Tax=Streptomyces sp. NPDC017936 TaxID=3365016 RepID=UPI0037AF995D
MKSVRSYLAVAAPLSAILAVGICGVNTSSAPAGLPDSAPAASAVRAGDDSGWGRVVTEGDSGWGRVVTAGDDSGWGRVVAAGDDGDSGWGRTDTAAAVPTAAGDNGVSGSI